MLPLILLLCLLPVSDGRYARQAPAYGLAKYLGKYISTKYNYSLQIPKGLVGLGSAVGAPNHGFIVEFSEKDDDYILVNAEYDVDEIAPHSRENISKYEPPGFQVLERKRTRVRLDGVKADEVWAMMKRKADGIIFTEIGIGLERRVQGTLVRYSLILHTPEKNYQARHEIFKKLIDSFHWLK